MYPLSDQHQLGSEFIGKSIQDLPVPAAILDVAKLRENCKLMLEAVKDLEVSFRAHVKTHKTLQLAEMQVGENCKDVRLIVSTVMEAEQLIPLLQKFQTNGAKVNVLYGIPVGISHIERLAAFAKTLGEGSLTLMIDHPDQLATVTKLHSLTRFPIDVFIKTDSGYHRAGLPPSSSSMNVLVKAVSELEQQGHLNALGFYSHNSLSYGGSHPSEAMDNLRAEIEACREATKNITSQRKDSNRPPIIISCGASPTALSIQNIQTHSTNPSSSTTSAQALREALNVAKSDNIEFEIHAGVYPVFDMQQVAASSRDTFTRDPHDSIALSILTEVCSLYPDRTDNPEALTNAGGLALAREACYNYKGHGVVSGWNMPDSYNCYSSSERVIVNRVSQEHGILSWDDQSRKQPLPLKYGQKLRIWPNHACITGAMYGSYFVIDSEDESKGEKIVDIWIRWRGW